MAAIIPGAMRRRLRGKQSAPYPVQAAAGPSLGQDMVNPALPGADHAITLEHAAADGLLPLPWGAPRRHIHWTHCRTDNADDVQPHELSRADFWQHLLRCYREAYPKAGVASGSPLQFGLVCKELHHDAPRAEDRSEHHHAATFSSSQIYWRKIAKLSHVRYHIKLNAAAHDAYASMYTYLRVPSAKKPLHELDAEPYFSPEHPQGDQLKDLLEAGSRYLQLRRERHAPAPGEPTIRSQFGVLFNWVVDHRLAGARGVEQLKVDALSELKAGRPKLIDFVKKHRASLRDQLDFCWDLVGAGQTLQRLTKTRVEILFEAATGPSVACANGHGACGAVYDDILWYQGVAPHDFQHSLFETLLHGRREGNTLMVIGGRDTGKTTITDPARLVFKAMPTPQADSFCPLQDVRGHEVFLWQDFRYCPGHPRVQEQGLRLDEGTWNRLLEGLPTLIGVAKTGGSRGGFVYDEDAAFILTGPSMMAAYKNGVVDEYETAQLTCRVKYWHFSRPAPEQRNRDFKACVGCWSRWLLQGEVEWQAARGIAPDEFIAKASAALSRGRTTPGSSSAGHEPPSTPPRAPPAAAPLLPVGSAGGQTGAQAFFEQLSQLMAWRQAGLLSDSEFASAKRVLGL